MTTKPGCGEENSWLRVLKSDARVQGTLKCALPHEGKARLDCNDVPRRFGASADARPDAPARRTMEVTMGAKIWPVLLLCGLAIPADAQQAPTPVHGRRRQGRAKRDHAKPRRSSGASSAVNRVEVRARVTGYLEEVLFKEGEPVKAGAPLYRIEHGLFQAAVEQAQGALERQQGSASADPDPAAARAGSDWTGRPARSWRATGKSRRPTRRRAAS